MTPTDKFKDRSTLARKIKEMLAINLEREPLNKSGVDPFKDWAQTENLGFVYLKADDINPEYVNMLRRYLILGEVESEA